MQTKQLSSKEEIKTQIIKDRLRKIFSDRSKEVAKILTHILKRHKNV